MLFIIGMALILMGYIHFLFLSNVIQINEKFNITRMKSLWYGGDFILIIIPLINWTIIVIGIVLTAKGSIDIFNHINNKL